MRGLAPNDTPTLTPSIEVTICSSPKFNLLDMSDTPLEYGSMPVCKLQPVYQLVLESHPVCNIFHRHGGKGMSSKKFDETER